MLWCARLWFVRAVACSVLQMKRGTLGRIVMELLPTSLASVLHTRGDFNPPIVRYLQNLGGKLLTPPGKEDVITGIARGMMYLHMLRTRIIHGDLKPEKVLLDVHGTPKISCDFVRDT